MLLKALASPLEVLGRVGVEGGDRADGVACLLHNGNGKK